MGLVWFLNQANREPFKTQLFCLGMPWSLMLQPQVEDGHSRKKFNTHSGTPINIKAKEEEVNS